MAFESVALSAFSLMGYWLRAHSGLSNKIIVKELHRMLLVSILFGGEQSALLSSGPYAWDSFHSHSPNLHYKWCIW